MALAIKFANIAKTDIKLQAAERNQRQRTPSSKIGAAVLAPLGAFESAVQPLGTKAWQTRS